MAYTILKTHFDPYIVRLILSFHQSFVPEPTDLYHDQMSTIHYYILFVVPKAKAKFGAQWKRYVKYNPFIQAYLLSRKFYDEEEDT